jgi:hypothetical protein
MPLLRRHRCRLERRPEEAGQLARDRDRDLGRGLVLFGEAPEAATQSLLRLVRNRNHTAWLSLTSSRERHPDARPVLIMPRRFDQQPANQRVPGPRDPTAPMFLAGGVLTRHEAEIRHQRAGRVEPAKVMQLGQDQDRRQRVNPAKTPQPTDRFPIRCRLGDLGQSPVELDQPSLEMIDR